MTKQTHFKQTHLKKAGNKLRVGSARGDVPPSRSPYLWASLLNCRTLALRDTRVPSGRPLPRSRPRHPGTPEGAAAVRSYRDPQTGKIEVPPAGPPPLKS